MAKKKVAKIVEEQAAPPAPIARAEKCVICDREYTNRRMGEGNGQPVCTDCLPKALAEEKAAKEAAVPAEEEVASEDEPTEE